MKKKLVQEILEFIRINQTVSTLEICERYQISESTTRRLLQNLEDSGKIRRYHGGAMFIGKGKSTEIQSRYHVCEESKEKIAKKAASMVQPNKTIMLLGGTTVFRMCKYLKYKKLTVITNSMLVFNELHNYPNIHLILLGGEYNSKEEELYGFLTQANSKKFTCDYLFFSVSGYIESGGFTTSDFHSIELYTWCMTMSEKVILLFDSSKFHMRGKAITAELSDLTCLITDENIEDSTLKELKNKKLNIIIAKENVNE